ncbi:tellurite resistance/C4-dicarboxylate transporter family protein [Streptomyces nodosus]|uniref:tellurite resistance/C4-dicarboxylate transporter family protein n=1 Tax=Streptomyces nodosus TaxID=40318 RepID=UPI0036EA153F
MSGTPVFRSRWARRPPATGAAAMATGVLSIGLRLAGHEVLSAVALALTVVAWLGLVGDVVLRLLPPHDLQPADPVSPASLAAVAATTVLGARLSSAGQPSLAEALLALAVVLWVVLLPPVVRRWRRRRTSGAVFLGCVATEGIAVLGAVLATALSVAWLAHTALVFFWLGLVFYLIGLRCFDRRQVATGAGDQWIAGGALALSAYAGSRLVAAGRGGPYLWDGDDEGVLRVVTLALLALALAWYCVLAAAELIRPRLGHDVRRWSTVFPLGMTAVAALSVGMELGVPWLRVLGRVLLWIAVAAWCAVLASAAVSASRGPESVRSRAPR